jgi:hypothetical protein
MKRVILLGAILVMAWPTQTMAVNEVHVKKIKKLLLHPDLKEDKAIFDGKAFKVSDDDALAYSNKFNSRYNELSSTFRRLSRGDLGLPEIQALIKQKNAKYDWSAAMAKVFKAKRKIFNDQREAASGQCSPFRDNVINANKREMKPTFARLISMIDFDGMKKEFLETPKQITRHRKALEIIDRECAKAEYKVFVAKGLCRYNSQPVDDPYRVCQVAGKKEKILSAYISNFGKRAVAGLGGKAREGKDVDYYPHPMGFRYKALLSVGAEEKKSYSKRVLPLYKAAGIASPDLKPAWEEIFQLKTKVKESVDKAAKANKPGFLFKGKKSHYSIRLAKKLLKSHYRKAKISKAIYSNKWLVKTRFGRPYERTTQAYILFQLKGDPWCMTGKFFVTEKHDGKRMKKARSALAGGVRFQPCR